MKLAGKFSLLLFLAALTVTTLSAQAKPPVKQAAAAVPEHAGYQSALSDLNAARAYLNYLGANERIDVEETQAIDHIDKAMAKIKEIVKDEGLAGQSAPIDTQLKRGDRYRRALELVDKAERDCQHEKSDPRTNEMDHYARYHLGLAHKLVQQAIDNTAKAERGQR